MQENDYRDDQYEEVEEVVSIDLGELAKRYEERSFFKRLADMQKGLSMPRDSREYKAAKIELQRLSAPLIAIIVPVLIVIVLIVVTAISGTRKETIKVEIAPPEEPEQEIVEEPPPPDDIEPPPMEEVEIQVDTPNPATPSEMTPMPSPPSTQVSVQPAEVESVSFVKSPIRMKSMVGSRNPGTIGARTGGGAGYGDARTEAAVMKVLWWLKDTQKTDGTWGPGCIPANIGFALLTFLAHGEYPGSESPYQRDFGPVVMAAVDWICDNVYKDASGLCKIKNSDVNEYAFLISAYAMAEAYGMTKNPNIKDVAEMMLQRIVKGQGPTGGWDYKLNPTSSRDDVSYMGWAIQALKAGKMAGLKPEGLDLAIKKAIHCLKTRNYSKTGGFSYTPLANNTGGRTGLAGVGTLAMQLLGRGSEPESLNGLQVMRKWVPTFQPTELDPGAAKSPGTCPQYYCYYAAQCKYQAGMKSGASKEDERTWYEWNAAMKKLYPSAIIDLPKRVKDWSGKDHKQGYYKNNDKYTARPVMDTCLVALQLMVYYRYLPTTQTAAGADDSHDGPAEDAADAAVDKGSDVPVTVDI